MSEVTAAPAYEYTEQEREFHKFWYGHMSKELMQSPLIGVAYAQARYIWDAACSTPIAGAEPPKQGEAGFTPDLVEERLNSWRQRLMNKSGDRLALDDFMGQESIDDLIDFVCAPSPSVEPAPEQKKAHHEDGLGQFSTAHGDSFTPQADFKPTGPPFYVGGPYLDGSFAICDLFTGRVLRMFRGEDDLLLAAGTKTVHVGLQSFRMTDCAPAPHQEPGWVRVPVEPTPEMIKAHELGVPRILPGYVGAKEKADKQVADRYRAMLAAAPKEPKP